MGASTSKPMPPKGVDSSGTPATTLADEGKSGVATTGRNTSTAPTSTSSADESSGGGGCPMKRSDGSYQFSLAALSRGFQHPNVGATNATAAAAPPSQSGNDAEGSNNEGKCPVQSNKKQQQQHIQEYNVYAQPISPSNQMPGTPNQLPSPQQSKPLSTERVESTIPKGGTDGGKTWTYPSPQMFYNALARKGKLDDTREDDMDNVVAMHNNMNEKTWRKVLQWEEVAGHKNVKLLKFQGRPTDLSPKAYVKSVALGHPLPFDRHDWVVLRDDNTTVRYVIDYYYDESRARDSPDSAMPPLQDDGATPSLLVDVRPALDGPRQFYERVVAMPLARHLYQTTEFQPLPMFPSTNMKSQVSESIQVWQQIQHGAKVGSTKPGVEADTVSETKARELAQRFATVRSKCALQDRALSGCNEAGTGGNEDCGMASLNWTLCAAPVLCELQHQAFQEALRSGSDPQITSALATVTDCVAFQSTLQAAAKSKYPELFQGSPK